MVPFSQSYSRPVGSGGRPAGRQPTELERRHLRLLMEVRARATHFSHLYDEQLEDFVSECLETGCSVRSLADALDVGPTTVQQWAMNARRRRAGG